MTERLPDDLYGPAGESAAAGELRARPERRYLRPGGSRRYVAFTLQARRPTAPAGRAPLALALVLDRSGSMAGDKLQAAKRAALAVLGGLTPRDRVAIVIFDDQIE